MNKLKKEIDWAEVYTDQAGKSTVAGDRVLTSFYTSWGIRNIDTWYCNLIRNMPNTEFANNLEKEIANNPHLHGILRDNLLENLRNYRSGITPENQIRWDLIESKKPKKGRIVNLKHYGKVGFVVSFDDGPHGIRVGVSLKGFDCEADLWLEGDEVEVINE